MSADRDLERLLDHVRAQRGVDFSQYKRPSLERRIAARMQDLGIEDYAAYFDHLQASPDEFAPLLDRIFINVTRFFRDPEVWETLRDDVLPEILDRARENDEIRIWCAGAASGEEAYSVVMLLAEALGPRQALDRLKVYATDLDEDALAQGREARYSAKALQNVPDEMRERYFVEEDDRFLVRGDVRRTVVFGRHDLLEDAPISRLELLVCRNTLMYLNAEAQNRILTRFHFALNEGGFLFLGKAEMLLTRQALFTPRDLKRRIFEKVAVTGAERRDYLLTEVGGGNGLRQRARHGRIRDLAIEAVPNAMLVVNEDGALVVANREARELFGLRREDLGRPFRDLQVSFRPIELRSRLEDAREAGGPLVVEGVDYRAGDDDRQLEFWIGPLMGRNDETAGLCIAVRDTTRFRELNDELKRAYDELETAYQELEATNEELETTNEELHSTVEELETSNEELQATNEEFETMNEELHATNEELEALNEQLRDKSDELDLVNAYLEAIVASLRVAMAVVDREKRVEVWNELAWELWGLREDEVRGRPLTDLEIGLPLEQLRERLDLALQGGEPEATMLEARDRLGFPLQCRVTCASLYDSTAELRGAILLMERWEEEAA